MIYQRLSPQMVSAVGSDATVGIGTGIDQLSFAMMAALIGINITDTAVTMTDILPSTPTGSLMVLTWIESDDSPTEHLIGANR